MYITISFWVVYGVFLFLNLNQVFWGLSLKSYPNKSSFLSELSFILPFAVALSFGLNLAINSPSLEKVNSIFIFWALMTAITFVILLARYLKKQSLVSRSFLIE